jgi:hypothetical protein
MSTLFTGALINDEHTLRDWNAIITNSDVVSLPEANTVLLEIPGRSGRLDLSEVLTGDVSYSNRKIKLVLATETNRERWQETCLHIFNKCHGRTVHVTFDEDTLCLLRFRPRLQPDRRVLLRMTQLLSLNLGGLQKPARLR